MGIRPTTKQGRIARDTVVTGAALILATVEILFLGGRTGVLTFCAGLLVGPLALRIDEVRKAGNGKNGDGNGKPESPAGQPGS